MFLSELGQLRKVGCGLVDNKDFAFTVACPAHHYTKDSSFHRGKVQELSKRNTGHIQS